jgi:4-amino-4-deoxy-L-arabinose transferase-like glycosyltransferase
MLASTTFLRDIANGTATERFVAWLGRVPLRDGVLLALIVAVIVFPLISIRAYHYEEGLTAALAKNALTGNHWYLPELFGVRWVERPVMQSWIIAAISIPLGGVSQITVRLPTVAALLSVALLLSWLLRERVSRTATLVAALCFLFSPAILQKAVTAEADTLVTAFEFAALVLWWKGYETGRVGLLRWLTIGLLLAATALCKGPQPAAFFPLGVGAFILVKRDWRQLPGYALAGIISMGMLGAWYVATVDASDANKLLVYMRLAGTGIEEDGGGGYFIERFGFAKNLIAFLPGLLLTAPLLLAWIRRKEPSDIGADNRTLVLALAFYAGIALLALVLWPGAKSRYAMPALPAIAALAGLAFDRLAARRSIVSRAALTILSGLIVYQIVWGWIVAPLFPDRFSGSRIAAKVIEAATSNKPYVIFAPLRLNDAPLAYLDRPVRYIPYPDLVSLPAPSFLLIDQPSAEDLAARRNDVTLVLHAIVGERGLGLYEVVPR